MLFLFHSNESKAKNLKKQKIFFSVSLELPLIRTDLYWEFAKRLGFEVYFVESISIDDIRKRNDKMEILTILNFEYSNYSIFFCP
jgi:hypothetical protein